VKDLRFTATRRHRLDSAVSGLGLDEKVRPARQCGHPAPGRTAPCRHLVVQSRHGAAARRRRLATAEQVGEGFLEEVVAERVDDGVDGAVGVAQDGEQLSNVHLPAL